MKRNLCLLLTMAIIVFLAGYDAHGQATPRKPAAPPRPAEEIQKIKVSMASSQPEGQIFSDAAKKFKELAEAKGKGNVKVDLFLGGSMGNEEDMMKAVTAGAIEGQATGGIPINAYAPPFYFIDTPFVMKDWNHVMAVWNSPLGDRLRASVEAAGNTTLVGPIYRGQRHFTSKKPVLSPKDLKGIKLRMPVLPTWISVWTEVGASCVPIPIGELYTALATGVADASEGDLTQIQSLKLHEVQTHLSLTGHLFSMGFFGFNTKWLNGLNAATRKLVIEAANEAVSWASKTMQGKEDHVIKALETAGMKVVQADKESFVKLGTPAMEKLFKSQFRVTSLEEVMSYAK